MRVAILGRTKALLDAARLVMERGHTIPVVWTCRAEAFYDAREDDFRALAHEAGADFFNELAIGSPANLAVLQSYQCDAAISVNWLTVLGPTILNSFPLGVLNAHAGDLPRFRGNACPNWAILSGERQVGLCVHRMAPELDAGPVLVRDRFALNEQTYIGDVYRWLDGRIPEMFAEAIAGLADGTIKPVPQPDDMAFSLRSYPRRPEDARISWSWPCDQVLAMVRASSHPFSGAFAYLEGRNKVTIWRAQKAVHPGAFLAVPGQVCFSLEGDPVIACSDGVIQLTDIAIEIEGASLRDIPAKQAITKSSRNRLT